MPRDPQGGLICIQHGAYQPILPTSTPLSSLLLQSQRPRVLAYIRRASYLQANPRFDICNDLDIQVIDILGVEEPFSIVNLYNEKQLRESSSQGPSQGQRTIERILYTTLEQLDKPAILAGDFNLHHFWWNAAAEEVNARKAESLIAWLQRNKA